MQRVSKLDLSQEEDTIGGELGMKSENEDLNEAETGEEITSLNPTSAVCHLEEVWAKGTGRHSLRVL